MRKESGKAEIAGALAGAATGAATGEKGNRLKRALVGAGIGSGGAHGVKRISKSISSRGLIDAEKIKSGREALDKGWDDLLGKSASVEKEAFLGALFKKTPKAPFVPKFKGHSQAVAKATGPAKSVSGKGVTTTRQWDPMTQSVKKQRYIELDKAAAFEAGVLDAMYKAAAFGRAAAEGAKMTVGGVTKVRRGGKWVAEESPSLLSKIKSALTAKSPEATKVTVRGVRSGGRMVPRAA